MHTEKKVQAREKEIERMWKREKWTMKEIQVKEGDFDTRLLH
jgi:hypothetical protein